MQASLGVPDLDVSGLFREIAQGDSVSYGEQAIPILNPSPLREEHLGY